MKKTPYLFYPKTEIERLPFLTTDILEKGFILEYESNESIVKEMEPLNFLYLILKGKAKIIKNEPNGKRTILQFLRPNDLIGDLTVIKAEEEPKEVISIGKTCCLGIPISYVEKYLMDDPIFLKYISKYIGQKLLKRMDHFSASQTFELKYRLAELFLVASVEGFYSENQVQISEYLGVSYRHLMYTLKFFKEEGYIQKADKGYNLNLKKLQAFIKEGNNK